MTALYAAVDMRAPAQHADAAGAEAARQDRRRWDSSRSLLAHKADPNARLKKPIIGRHQNLVGDASLAEGATALARASKGGDLPVMRAAPRRRRRRHAHAEGPDDDGDDRRRAATPEPKALEAVQLLVDHGVDVNAFNANGQTILHNAAGRGANSIVQFVADRGAKLDRRDKQSRTALDIALGARRRRGRRGARPPAAVAHNPTSRPQRCLRQLMAKQGLTVNRSLPPGDTEMSRLDPRRPGGRRDRAGHRAA